MRTGSHGIGGFKSTFPNLGVSSYQRAVVWKGSQKARFIQSILNDYPTGILVFNKIERRTPDSPTLSASHDIIDGQQRVTTIYEFLENPLVYVTNWLPRKPKDPEVQLVADIREKFQELIVELRRVREGYLPRGTPRKELLERVYGDAGDELRRRLAGVDPANPKFVPLVDKMLKFYQEVSGRQLVVQELDNIESFEAERMYRIINVSGTELLWWELFRVDRTFAGSQYVSLAPYATTYNRLVATLSRMYRSRSKVRTADTNNDSYWDSLFALGEYYHLLFDGKDPTTARELVAPEHRLLNVDGLGFRLVSAVLSGEVSRVAINKVRAEYSESDLRKAIDSLFDAGDLLFRGVAHFKFFQKYTAFGREVIPAYPLVGIIVAAAKMVAINKQAGNGITLSQNDTLNLRALTEELFRESLCTPKWAGSGDSKLKGWLDSHFKEVSKISESPPLEPFPGRLVGASSTFDRDRWQSFLGGLGPMNQRTVDRRSMFLHFWVQYLCDSKVAGCLPSGVVEFDHIVAFQDTPGSLTTHPVNYAAISERLNRLKRKQSYLDWAPAGADDTDYRRWVLDDFSQSLSGSPPLRIRFLPYANHGNVYRMIEERKRVLEYVLTGLLPDWITNGD